MPNEINGSPGTTENLPGYDFEKADRHEKR
jgi:hypothetical protein